MLFSVFCQKQSTDGVLAIFLLIGPKSGEELNLEGCIGFVHGVFLLNNFLIT